MEIKRKCVRCEKDFVIKDPAERTLVVCSLCREPDVFESLFGDGPGSMIDKLKKMGL